ncbi:hypothetical protein ACEQPO_23915 [Bacillus sp. SL00103]
MAATALIFFFVAPLIDLVMPNFHFTNPVTDVYLSINMEMEITLEWCDRISDFNCSLHGHPTCDKAMEKIKRRNVM